MHCMRMDKAPGSTVSIFGESLEGALCLLLSVLSIFVEINIAYAPSSVYS